MLEARPAMAVLPNGERISRDDPIWKWTARRFAGAAAGEPVFWNDTVPEGGAIADHEYPTGSVIAFIRIRDLDAADLDHPEQLFDELWHSAVFELFNMSRGPEFYQVYQDALERRMSRETWVERNLRLEYSALLDTARFYRETWYPFAEERGFPTHRSVWRADMPATYEAWLALYRDSTVAPWDSWEDYYDESLVPYYAAKRRAR